jgi:acyl carrier protein
MSYIENYVLKNASEKIKIFNPKPTGYKRDMMYFLGIKDINTVNAQSTLADLGMDSLMGAEIKQTLERNYDFVLSAQEIRNLTFARLSELSSGAAGTPAAGDSAVTTVSPEPITNGQTKEITPTHDTTQVRHIMLMLTVASGVNYYEY